jgi:hypothetical protein
MDDANLPAGADTAPNEAISDSDDLNQRLAALIDSGEPLEESTAEGADNGQPDDDKPEPDAEPLYTVKVDGQEIQVKQSELLAGYQRDADYRNKTKEVSAQRQAVEAERQSVVQERERALQVVERFQAELGQLLQPNIDWNALLESDPAEYLRQERAYNQRLAQYNQAEQAKQYLQSQQAAEQNKHLQARVQTETENLLKALPDWKDAPKAKAGKEAIKGFLQTYGYSEAEIGTIVDHRAIVIADKARKYDELMNKAKLTQKKVASLPSRVERPGNSESRPDGRADAIKRVGKTGSITDAANAFSHFL